MFRISKNFSVPLMSELFYHKVNHYDLRNPYEFSIPNVNSIFHGQASIRCLGPLIWQLVPSEFKDLSTISAFKAAIKKWKPNNCPCRLKIYWKCCIFLNYLFGVNNRHRWECRVFFVWFPGGMVFYERAVSFS